MTKPRTFALCALLLLVGCRVEDTKPVYQDSSRLRAVQEAERKRAEAQAKPGQTPPAGGPSAGGTPPPRPSGTTGSGGPRKPAGYLPPSEQGARVEMSETPAGAPPPPPSTGATPPAPAAGKSGAAEAPGAAGETRSRQGGTGGNVPHGIAPTARQGVGGGMPPGAAGSLGNAGTPPPVSGPNALPATPMGDPTGTEAELARNRQAFEEQMRQGGGGKPGGKDQENSGDTRPAGYGGGGATPGGTGLGASHDLTGVRGVNPNRNAPSAQPRTERADETIVARQLREAAEREQDPVLKQKLLLEYRKYTAP